MRESLAGGDPRVTLKTIPLLMEVNGKHRPRHPAQERLVVTEHGCEAPLKFRVVNQVIMEAVDFQSDVVVPRPPPPGRQGGFDAPLPSIQIADSLVGTDLVRYHTEELPGLRPPGTYYRFNSADFGQWMGVAASSSRSNALSEFDRLHSAVAPGQLSITFRSDLHPCTPKSSSVAVPDSSRISADAKLAGAEDSSQALHLGTSSSNVMCATPVKRRGKSMSRRTGQAGHIERSGKWWVVRWWMDLEGQDNRVHKRARICPISGPGVLSKSERTRRARQIIAESGADTVEHFNAVVVKKQETVTTFQEQGARWLEALRTRKRKPVALSTTEDWERILGNWLNPHIGTLPISEVNNASLKRLVAAMSGAGLSPKTIDNYAGLVKMVVASAVDAEGEEIFPRKWNHEFIDMPVVEKSKQNTPCFSGDVMTGLAGWKKPRERVLFILCGAAGLRIGEALGIEIDKHIASDFSLLKIRQKARPRSKSG